MSARPKHTPGPWRVLRSEGAPSQVAEIRRGLGIGADCGLGDENADARLIAAVPNLLFAARRALALLEDVTRSLPGEYEEVALLRAAIAQAEVTP